MTDRQTNKKTKDRKSDSQRDRQKQEHTDRKTQKDRKIQIDTDRWQDRLYGFFGVQQVTAGRNLNHLVDDENNMQ